MSTGENINANGQLLTADLVRFCFHRFPQSTHALVARNVWSQIAPLQIMRDYPFKAVESDIVPPGEIWFADPDENLLGRIVHIAVPPGPVSALTITSTSLTQNGSNFTAHAAWTDTPNVSTAWEIWTNSAKASKAPQVVDSGELVNGTGNYSVTSGFKADPHANVFITVRDVLGGEASSAIS